MPIPMEPPAVFMAGLKAGDLVRYGAIIKDVGTGKIVGHLKEAGQFGEILSGLGLSPANVFRSFNPLSAAAELANIALNVDSSVQLRAIKEQLNALQLMTNVAALTSVAGLGVSIGGFAALNAKLSRIETKLDSVASNVATIKATLAEMQMSWETMALARIENAAQTLVTAENATEDSRRLELAKEAASEFARLRHFYGNMLKCHGLFHDLSLSVGQVQELIVRYTLCCVGVLHAEFMVGDIGAYRSRLENIQSGYAGIVSFSPKTVYQARCDNLQPLALDADFEGLSHSLTQLRGYVDESVARVESFAVELKYIEDNKLGMQEYQQSLKKMDTGLVVLPVAGGGLQQ